MAVLRSTPGCVDDIGDRRPAPRSGTTHRLARPAPPDGPPTTGSPCSTPSRARPAQGVSTTRRTISRLRRRPPGHPLLPCPRSPRLRRHGPEPLKPSFLGLIEANRQDQTVRRYGPPTTISSPICELSANTPSGRPRPLAVTGNRHYPERTPAAPTRDLPRALQINRAPTGCRRGPSPATGGVSAGRGHGLPAFGDHRSDLGRPPPQGVAGAARTW